jgi:hypothetical protein
MEKAGEFAGLFFVGRHVRPASSHATLDAAGAPERPCYGLRQQG